MQLLNIEFIFSTFIVTNSDKSRDVKLEHELNKKLILVTDEVSKFLKLISLIELSLSILNNELISLIKDELKCEKST